MGRKDEQNKNNEWPPYGIAFIWLPIILGLVTPLIVYSAYDSHFIVDLLKEKEEGFLMTCSLLFYNIPFIITSFMTRQDWIHKTPFPAAFKKWLLRVVPAFLLYVFLLIDVTRAAALKLPGASTAPMVLTLFPIMGSLLVFIGNCVAHNSKWTSSIH